MGIKRKKLKKRRENSDQVVQVHMYSTGMNTSICMASDFRAISKIGTCNVMSCNELSPTRREKMDRSTVV